MLDHLEAQLAEFRRDDEERWKYEAEQMERQTNILEGVGRTEEQTKADLEKAGINVKAVEEDSERSERELARAHKQLLEIEPPPEKRGRKEPIMMEHVAALAGSHTWLYPPAYEGWGNSEQCGFNLALGEINDELHSSGAGGGWGCSAFGYGTQYCTLWFYYFPPRAGDLRVQPHVDFQGNVAVSAHDHWYTCTHARLQLRMHFDLYQHYWDGEQSVTIVDEHRHNSSSAYWVNQHRILSKSMSVSASDIVWIKLTTSLWGFGKSSHAHVDADFRTGASRRIRVEHIWVDLT